MTEICPEALKNIDFYSLFGKKQSDPSLNFITQLDGAESKEYSDCAYITFKKYGVQFQFAKSTSGEKTLDGVFIFNTTNRQKFAKYLGNLPLELNLDMNNVDIVKKFGEPEGKPKPSVGGIVNIYVDYKKIGMQIDFLHASYEHVNNPIELVCFYPPSK
jgi:hypothetical protein